ncbi:ROK family transcriptional regulator [Demequina lignilytica]|uniref:ROK family transcriptional regulator n=1 Tax=Demequina lignilytica TaxID=3051663 RepID=A0AAW7M8S2_9MICO|nr:MULTISPECIES: ROK family transcriptional regulator [unclassified Demequina]MDN4477534.1 ROK family transcriptional regulator [Demequina sp. SYSU T00039-1]MDN4483579.1 ROK family transcriptional regulator [Demequina sp. SYSU T0a273]MDN4488115.1 ROK family transcriptional regulator [Demequina sp. SYSU T00039]MDN4490556.1 ROK family transcriptional regulator [Demequina sp. SYSU T00068]
MGDAAGARGDVRLAHALPSPPDRAADASTLRAHNLGIVMRLLREHGTVSRKDIEQASGMVPASVLNLLGDLESRGLVREVRHGAAGEVRGRGRPRVMVEAVGDRCLALAVRVTRERITSELHSSTGVLLDSASRAVAFKWGNPDAAVAAVADLVARALATAADRGGLLMAVVVAMPGPVGKDNTLADSVEFGWGHVGLEARLREAGTPDSVRVEVVNEGDVAGLAEYWELPSPRPSVMLFLNGDRMIGGGVVQDGRVLVGAHGFGGALGHVTVDWRGRSCECGSIGCLNAYIGAEALLTSARLIDHVQMRGTVAAMLELQERLDRGERRAVDVAIRAGDILGAAMRSVYDVVNPAALVLGGHLAWMRRWLEPGVQMQLATRTERLAPVRITTARLGSRAGLVGAARYGLEVLFDDPTVVPVLEDAPARLLG